MRPKEQPVVFIPHLSRMRRNVTRIVDNARKCKRYTVLYVSDSSFDDVITGQSVGVATDCAENVQEMRPKRDLNREIRVET